MHWSDIIAKKIIDKNPNKNLYTCAAGISPSGSVHIGNFRDIATSLFVVLALKRAGKNARLLFSWDEFDRLRKIPKNVSEKVGKEWDKYIGYPYADAPSPFSENESYACFFEKEFESAIEKFGISPDFRRQSVMYRAGKYKDYVITALKKRGEIFDILDSFRTQDAVPGERDAYFPVSIYCPTCKRDDTKITSISDDCKVAKYSCKCSHQGEFNFEKDFNCKLSWKIDWPMRWKYEQVDFEPGGKDHASPTGSYQTSKIISEKIFDFTPPEFQGYEFIGIKGAAGKMSGSTGLNLTPKQLLKLYQPEVILWLYAKADPLKAFDFCFDDGILRQYHEFDTGLKAYYDNKSEEYDKAVFECCVGDKKLSTVPMNLIVQLGSIVNFNADIMTKLFEKIDMPYKKSDIESRLSLGENWISLCAPDKKNVLLKAKDEKYFSSLTDEEKKDIKALHNYLLGGGYTLEELSTKLYDIVKQNIKGDANDASNKKIIREKQGKFFKNVYKLLIGKETGPRLYFFLYAIDVKDYIQLLDF